MAYDGGLSRFQRRMRAIPREVRQAVAPALVREAEKIAGEMRRLAPVDSGDLRDSITVTPPGFATPPYSQPGGSQVAPSNAALITAGNSDVRYAHLIEYGTTRAPSHAFFWPAYRLGKKAAAKRIKRAISKAVREAR